MRAPRIGTSTTSCHCTLLGHSRDGTVKLPAPCGLEGRRHNLPFNMPRSTSLSAIILAAALVTSPSAQQPTFKSGVDLIRLDVHVVGDDGTPIKDLAENDFDVKVNGKAAPVRALQFLDLARRDRTASEEARYRDVSTNQESLRGRLTVLVIDESSLP